MPSESEETGTAEFIWAGDGPGDLGPMWTIGNEDGESID